MKRTRRRLAAETAGLATDPLAAVVPPPPDGCVSVPTNRRTDREAR